MYIRAAAPAPSSPSLQLENLSTEQLLGFHNFQPFFGNPEFLG